LGRTISNFSEPQNDIQIVVSISPSGTINPSFPVFKNADSCDIGADLIIDFSHPSAFSSIV